MIGNILGEPFSDYVFKQIEQRQNIQGKGLLSNRTTEDINYLSNRNAWIKLASGVSVEDNSFGESRLEKLNVNIDTLKDINLAKKAILFNGVSELVERNKKSVLSQREGVRQDFGTGNFDSNSVYGFGDKEFGFTPPPGILSAEIDCINRGSIRQATVKLIAYNRFQFELIELLYLRLGFSMLLEWGWDKYLNNETGKITNMGNTLIEKSWFVGKGKSQLEFLEEIELEREKHYGNYDGFFGKVSNFNWELSKDGTYNITLKLITVGDVIESLNINIPVTHKIKSSNVNSTNKLNNNKKEETNARILELYDSSIVKNNSRNAISQWLEERIRFWDDEVITSHGFNFITKTSDFYEIPDTLIKNKGEMVGYTYYVRLGKFLEILQDLIIPIIDNGGDAYHVLEIDYNTPFNLLTFKDTLFPIDPRICIANTGGVINKNNEYSKIDTYLKPFIIGEAHNRKALLMNLYINFDFISKISTSSSTSKDDNISLFKFLEDLCNGINFSFGNYTKLEPIIKDDRIITIIDQKIIPELLNNIDINPLQQLEIFGYNRDKNTSNFIKDISFNTKITPALASQISIGATAGGSSSSIIEGTAFSRWNIGLIDRFAIIVGLAPPTDKPTPEESKDSAMQNAWDFPKEKNTSTTTITSIGFGSGTGIEHSTPTKIITYNGVTYPPLTYGQWQRTYNKLKETKIKADQLKIATLHLYINTWEDYIDECFGGINQITFLESLNHINSLFIREGVRVSTLNPKYFTFSPNFIKRGIFLFDSFIKKLKNEEFKETNQPSDLIGFLPITLDITTEGLSGIKIYQKLNINQRILPSQYDESFTFLITKVNHKIENNNWDTILGTLSTSNIKESIEDSIKRNNNNINNKINSNIVNEITPWSAVFISYVINKSGLNFPLVDNHIGYYQKIKSSLNNEYKDWEVFENSNEVLQKGDIIINPRVGGSHGEIVIDTDFNIISSIGGNVSDTVKTTKSSSNNKYLAILRPPQSSVQRIINLAKNEELDWGGEKESVAHLKNQRGTNIYNKLFQYWENIGVEFKLN